MKTIKDLTPEIREKIPSYLAKARNFYKGELPFNRKASEDYINLIYELAGQKKPEQILFAKNITEYSEIWLKINGKDSTASYSHYLWICSPYTRCYLTWYKFIADEFNLGSPELRAKLDKLYNLIIQSSIMRCWFSDKVVIVLMNPDECHFLNGRLHNEEGPALLYKGDFEGYYWKGTKVSKKLIMTPDRVTKSDIEEINNNAEVRRCYIEKLGVTNFFNILSDGKGLQVIDEDTDHQGYPMKLMSFDFEGQKTQVLEVADPSTGRVYNIYPPKQNSKNVWEAKADTFSGEKLTYRQGDVGLIAEGSEGLEKPLIET